MRKILIKKTNNMKNRIRISNKWNKDLNCYEKDIFDTKENEKSISGLMTIKLPFIAYKDKIDSETLHTLLNHGGRLIEVEGKIEIETTKEGKEYHRLNIRTPMTAQKPVSSFHETDGEDVLF